VSAESDIAREDSRISAISVRIDVGLIQLGPPEQAELLAYVERYKVYGTLRQACHVDVAVVNREAQALGTSAQKGGQDLTNGKRDFDNEARSWDENPLRRELGEALGKAIAAALPLKQSDTVLDYGAGTGLISLALSQQVSRVLAADSSRGMLDVLAGKTRAAGIANIEPILLDLEDPVAIPPTVDTIVSSMTLHHVRDIPRLARIFFSMLVPGGHIALADLSTEVGDFHSDNTGVHHFGFAADWLCATFKSAGFADAHTTNAYVVRKQVTSGEIKDFPILLFTAVKP
jgi:2-polyprenyl-3-methyl-5-hydroxy-6-metoxy-1,4-benzoquinol methylase